MLEVLIRFAKQPRAPLRYIATAYLVAVIPAIVTTFILDWIGVRSPHSPMNSEFERWFFYISSIAVAPALETLLMIPVFGLLRFFTQRTNWLCLWSATAWATLHGLYSWTWGITIFWTFFVLSFAFLTWEQRGKKWAFLVTTLIHALNNSVAVLLIVLWPKLG
jgi:hypothetical protein